MGKGRGWKGKEGEGREGKGRRGKGTKGTKGSREGRPKLRCVWDLHVC